MSKFVVYNSPSGFRFALRASNGQSIVTSEVYGKLPGCFKGIESVRRSAPDAHVEDQTLPGFRPQPHPKFEMYMDKAGEYRFRLKARNGKIIAVSEGYTNKSGCENGIESVRANAAEAEVVSGD